jgi:hypothetical protein
MTHHLRSCVRCARHIRVTEATCPFCAMAVPIERMTPPPLGKPAARLGRAFAMSTLTAAGALGSVASGCSPDSPAVISGSDANGALGPAESGLDANQEADAPAAMIPGADAYEAEGPLESGLDAHKEADAPAAVITGADAYGAVEPPESGLDAHKEADAPAAIITGADAYGAVEPPESGRD